MGLPTKVGYYEVSRGSTILRAKTPMYLIRPVNSSDSVLALSKGKGLGASQDSSDNISVSTLNSVESNLTSRGRKKNMADDMRIQVCHSAAHSLFCFVTHHSSLEYHSI